MHVFFRVLMVCAAVLLPRPVSAYDYRPPRCEFTLTLPDTPGAIEERGDEAEAVTYKDGRYDIAVTCSPLSDKKLPTRAEEEGRINALLPAINEELLRFSFSRHGGYVKSYRYAKAKKNKGYLYAITLEAVSRRSHFMVVIRDRGAIKSDYDDFDEVVGSLKWTKKTDKKTDRK